MRTIEHFNRARTTAGLQRAWRIAHNRGGWTTAALMRHVRAGRITNDLAISHIRRAARLQAASVTLTSGVV